MAGSVWEWTSTVHDGGYLLCGGSWLSKDPESHKASEHVWDSASSSSPANGFRCVRQAP
jgi:formylglycine-generating enzyme required for sulfatase activity